MKFLSLKQISALLVLAPLSAGAALTSYNNTFDSYSGSGGGYLPPVNFAPQDGWTTSENIVEDITFIYPAPSKASVAVGGFYSWPAGANIQLSKGLDGIPTVGLSNTGYFSTDIALIGTGPALGGGTVPFNDTNRDTFGIKLDNFTGVPLVTINFIPGAAGVRTVSVTDPNGTTATGATVNDSDYASPAYYNVYINFTKNGATDLDYSVFISGGAGIVKSGTILGGANETFGRLQYTWALSDTTLFPDPPNPSYRGNAGSNFLAIDNVSIPEPTTTVTGLLALGLLASRRRR